MSGPARFPVVRVAGIPLHAVTRAHAVAHVFSELDAGRGGWILTLGLEPLRLQLRDRPFRRLCREADLVLPESAPLVWASRVQGTPLPERVSGAGLVHALAAAAAEEARSAFLVGGLPATALSAAGVLRESQPRLRIVGSMGPSRAPGPFAPQDDRVADLLVATRPDLVFVGRRSPDQEQWIRRMRPVLPEAWWIAVGTAFSALAGPLPGAPSWDRLADQARPLTDAGLAARRAARAETRLHDLPFTAQLLAGAAGARLMGTAARSL